MGAVLDEVTHHGTHTQRDEQQWWLRSSEPVDWVLDLKDDESCCCAPAKTVFVLFGMPALAKCRKPLLSIIETVNVNERISLNGSIMVMAQREHLLSSYLRCS